MILNFRAVCKVEELYTYTENKAKFCKPIRRKFFHEGIQQLEQELKNDRSKPMADIAAIKGTMTNIILIIMQYNYFTNK